MEGNGSGGVEEGGEGVAAAGKINLIAYCYILPIICLVGMAGNAANLMTLASNRLRAVSYMYLRALALADLACMTFVLLFVIQEVLIRMESGVERQLWFAFYQAHLMLPLINWSISSGVLIVIALSWERFISVAYPIYFRSWNSSKRATTSIGVCLLASTLFYLPYAVWRHEFVWRDELDQFKVRDSNVSLLVGWKVYKYSREGALRILPIVLLAVLNVGIIIAFLKRRQLRDRLQKPHRPAKLQSAPSFSGVVSSAAPPQPSAGGVSTSSSVPPSSSSTGGSDRSLLLLLAGIVVMFFVCNIPAAINLIHISDSQKSQFNYQVFRAMANLLEIGNHATNFYVFCLCSSDYRTTLREKFPCVKRLEQALHRIGSFFCRRFDTAIHHLHEAHDSSELSAPLPPQPPRLDGPPPPPQHQHHHHHHHHHQQHRYRQREQQQQQQQLQQQEQQLLQLEQQDEQEQTIVQLRQEKETLLPSACCSLDDEGVSFIDDEEEEDEKAKNKAVGLNKVTTIAAIETDFYAKHLRPDAGRWPTVTSI